MYAPFFGLQHPPFSIAPDPRYLFMSERHREALAHLLYGLDAGGGFVLLTGEVGAGKTTVCRCFLEQIPSHCNVAYIFNPKLTVRELLRSICDEFGVPHKPTVPGGVETVKDYIDPLNASLLAAHAAGRNTVLIIDEAQNLSADVLEQLRLLTNLETSERKLLQIILIGQPELRAMVAKPSMEQLAQRVIARFHLGALSPQETQQYIAHRLAVAGLTGPLPFDRGALRRVHALSHGVPRRINLLCDRALLGAYAAGARQVNRAIVNRAAREVFDAPASAAAARSARQAGLPRWALAGLGAVAGAAAVAAAGWGMGVWPAHRGGPQVATTGPGAAVAQGAASSLGAKPPAAAAPAAVLPASAAAASAPVAAAPAVPASSAAPSSALDQFMQAQPATDAPAWQALASAWGAALPAGADACTTLPREGLRCYRNRRAGLNLVRQIDRPVLLALYPSEEAEAPVSVLLRGLDGDNATLEGGGRSLRVPVAELAQVWRGEIATLWRAPVGMPDRGEITDSPAGAAWLDQRLASKAAGGSGPGSKPVTPAQRQSRIHRFQLAQGVTPDGRAGPLTLMLLNRATGVNEPRLRNTP
ncbi:MAG: peptidoglycan-binding protein [Burkholderiales bacterium GWA2_64_37]|uniref:ExeA family protein n=1 Tax=unclassified Acidovorax TaxID=2684926 RepID=UPI0008AD8943|nr:MULTISPECIES: AAA family ATPase [unclassified Acidovorax]MBV7458219.1 AAA family ATPase [Acidovorax sp. sif0632]MBV7463959.1 AAA family ATPase [Acidovorax sp. sif0613]OGA85950.1 MAG: peptidoglycan-binding protein [Burkholderiales bacterium GWA2_64_37]HCE92537.1 peptidoglycan-binding protein [Acidovorax sp.]